MADEELCGCAICGAKHIFGVDVAKPHYPWPTVAPGHENRIEALRAASLSVQGVDVTKVEVDTAVLDLADRYVCWIETGKRYGSRL